MNMIIDTAHYGGTFYVITYLAAFATGAAILIRRGLKKSYPMNAWLLLILAGAFFFIIGNKMSGYSPEKWLRLFTGLCIPFADKKYLVGGVIGLAAGIWLTKILLRFSRPILDDFAILLPVCMAMSRVGCLFQGCCFGTPAQIPWAVRYGEASQAFQAHLANGWVHQGGACSLAVHPAQLYQVIGCLVIALLVWKTRTRWKAAGSMFVFSVLCYTVLRFFVEFVRAPESNFSTGHFFMGLKIIQWLTLAGLCFCSFILVRKEKRALTGQGEPAPARVPESRQAALTILFAILVLCGRNWFDPMEKLTLWLFLVPVLAFQGAALYRKVSVAGFRWVLPALMVCWFSLMAQTGSPDMKENDIITFTRVGLTGMAGTYYEHFVSIGKEWIPPSGGGCGTPATPGYWATTTSDAGVHKNTFFQGGVDVSHNRWVGKYYRYAIGARAFIGGESGPAADYPYPTSIGVSPYVSLDWRWVGFGAGLTIGQMKLPFGQKDPENFAAGDVISSDYKNFYILPAMSVRVGPSDLVYAEMQAPAMFPSASPLFGVRAGIGSGLGKTNGTRVGIGFCQGLYAMAKYPVKDRVELEAFYGDNLQGGSNSKRLLTFGFHYRFGYKKKVQ